MMRTIADRSMSDKKNAVSEVTENANYDAGTGKKVHSQ